MGGERAAIYRGKSRGQHCAEASPDLPLTCASSRSSFLLSSSLCSSSSDASARFLLKEDDDVEKGKGTCTRRDVVSFVDLS